MRGPPLSAAAKSLVLRARNGKKSARKYALTVIPGDRLLDMPSVARLLDVRKVEFVDSKKLLELIGCVSGSVPPFCFNSQVRLIADSRLRESPRMVFNAGRLDVSLEISAADYFEKLDVAEHEISRDVEAIIQNEQGLREKC
ncbi:Ala-tRNA(Pro) deacylase [Bradyrhizobium sp. USDA 4369]